MGTTQERLFEDLLARSCEQRSVNPVGTLRRPPRREDDPDATRAVWAAQGVTAEFGHWLAGFFAGEGSVGIYPTYRGRPAVHCQAKLSIRRDDRAILEEVMERTGIGRLYEDRKGLPGRARCVAWSIDRRDDCRVLVEIFETYPLRAKKARDFEIWAEAVREWCAFDGSTLGRRRDWTTMERLRQQLLDGRALDTAGAVWAD